MYKVLNIISDTNIGGAGRAILTYLKYRDKNKFDVSLVLPKGSLLKPRADALGVPVFELNIAANKSMDFSSIATLREFITDFNPDIVHTHGSMSGRIAAKKCGKAVVYTRHCAFPVPGYRKRGPGRWLNKLINEHYADKVIAISPAAAESLIDEGISSQMIDVMMNGVEPLTPADESSCAALREKLRIDHDDFVMGIIARIEEYKGHFVIIDAMKELLDEGRSVKLIIAGIGDFEQAVSDRTYALGLSDKVIFTGFVEDVTSVLSILDLQLNASFVTETSSLSVLEGFSLGVPAVVSNYSGNPWVVDEGEDGLLFENRDSHALADKIRLLMDDPVLKERLGRQAKEIYLRRFTGEIYARNVEAVYKKILEGGLYAK